MTLLEPSSLRPSGSVLPSAVPYAEATDGATLVGMPPYFLQDCHYFYRTALRGLNISTSVSPLYA